MTGAGIFLGVVIGFGLSAFALIAFEWLAVRARTHRLRGNYFDARQPFRIEARGPAPIVERPEMLIAREARRAARDRPRTAQIGARDRLPNK